MNSKIDETPPFPTNTIQLIPGERTAGKADPPTVTNEYDSTLKWFIPNAEDPPSVGLAETQPDLIPVEEHPNPPIHPTLLLEDCVTPEIPTPPLESCLPLAVPTPAIPFLQSNEESSPEIEPIILPSSELDSSDSLQIADPNYVKTPEPILEKSPNPELEKTLDEAMPLIVSAELQESESGPTEAEVELLESEERLSLPTEKEAAEFDLYGPTPPPIPNASALSAALPPAESDTPPLLVASTTPSLGLDLPEALARRPLQRIDNPWFEVIFDEDYLRTLPFTTQEQTDQEVEFLADTFRHFSGGPILDIACGYGRHALPLAKQGFQVTGIDLSLPLLLRAADAAQRLGLPVNFIHADMREISFQSQFSGAYCALTSFGYFDEETNLKLATAICQSLKPGGRFVLDVLNRDYVVSDLPSRVWWEGNGCVVLEEVEFNFQTSRLLIHRSIVFNEGHQVEQDLSLRVYCLHELGKILRTAGFRVLEVSGSLHTRGHFFGAASRQILLVCERPEM